MGGIAAKRAKKAIIRQTRLAGQSASSSGSEEIFSNSPQSFRRTPESRLMHLINNEGYFAGALAPDS
ncbi:MAG: hypothetical protein NOF05_05140 [Candidatus Accumulibacter phosphatis]|uniref:hypothetical protein n=1 Tax=Candidatus Accumulibacter TaxID=327159 RepID=UPI00110ADEEC|nr:MULTISPECIES: hypothetical protein [Candidatus Accumulibacter]MBN8518689.1 hypothetical protein [Accumulibacter sp.]MBO3710323.1 hypothetical protein [Accumulibacter sp.]MCC2868065.1 hypothetical protein [Candidatus Accumulibacter phosphatis]MCQ1548204.1 hypothetical protein [Candidatus Accumulibacter phosphatis]HMW57568.1 hypothetical protein [Accumulibacter sp.]